MSIGDFFEHGRKITKFYYGLDNHFEKDRKQSFFRCAKKFHHL